MAEDKGNKPPSSHPVRLRTRRPCPVCKQPSTQKYHPFCSTRCADVDLHRWLGGQYAVPAVDPPDFDEAAPGSGNGQGRSDDED